jgi:hypothetical protein
MKPIMKGILVGGLASAALFSACRKDQYDDSRRLNPPPSPEAPMVPTDESPGTGGSSNVGQTDYGSHVSSDSELTNEEGVGIGAAGNEGVIQGRGPVPESDKSRLDENQPEEKNVKDQKDRQGEPTKQ